MIKVKEIGRTGVSRVMRTPLLLGVLLLPALIGGSLLAPSTVAEACGPYGQVRSDLQGRIVSEQPPSAGFSVRAVCDDEVHEADVAEDGSFGFRDLPGRSCTLEAIAHECYTWDRRIEQRVSLPSEAVTLVIP